MSYLYRILSCIAKIFNKIRDYDVYGYELHHSSKADSPSGTAKAIGELLIKNIKRKNALLYDKIDRKILQELDWNARSPMNKIARTVHSNKDVVAYRIKRLEERGIIISYYPVLDMYKLGYHTIRLYFDLEEIGEEQEKAFVAFLDKEMHAGLIFRMDYPYRYGIFVWVNSIFFSL